jgi:hypothetical protein
MAATEVHEAAAIFPLDEEDINALADDILAHGLLVPVETLDGKVIDGRRRLLACETAGVVPTFRAVQVADPVAHVVSLSLHRRHLTPSQRSLCAARATAMREKLAAEAKERQAATRKRGNSPVPENLPGREKGDSRDQAGKMFGVSGRFVDYAAKVINNVVPEVVAAVDEGRMSVSTAAVLSSEPEAVQRAEAARPKRRRNYKSVSNPAPEPAAGKGNGSPGHPGAAGEIKGVGVIRAHEAINVLIRIPKNDPLRRRGFQVVTDWIRHALRGRS